MKFIRQSIDVPPEQLVTQIEAEEGESVITRGIIIWDAMRNPSLQYGELILPEGITEIEKEAFRYLAVQYRRFRFPRSLEAVGDDLFCGYSNVKVVYAGSSERFRQIAPIRKESVYESDGYDHYPYYSGNGGYVDHYYAFDTLTNSVEVYCEEDGVTLLYGTRYRRDGEDPQVKTEA